MHPALSQRFTNPAPGEGSLFIQASPLCAGGFNVSLRQKEGDVQCNVWGDSHHGSQSSIYVSLLFLVNERSVSDENHLQT
jgi:hypothetical protein